MQPRIEPIWKDYDIFDAHTHIEGGIVMPYDLANEFSAENLIAYMKEYNIKHAAVSALTKDFVGDNNKVAEAIRKYPGQLLGLAHIDPSRGDPALVEIDRCLKLGFRGLKLHPHYDGYMAFDLKLLSPVLEKAAHHRLPILVHTGTPPNTTPIHIGYLAQHFREVNFICGHMGWADSSLEAPEAGEMAENVYMDMTVASAHTYIERAIQRLGAERFVWGTDQPYLTFVGEFFKLLSLRIPDEDKRKILWENPKKIYRMT